MGAFVLRQSSHESKGQESASLYILGPARTLISQGLYARADLYFHKGAPPAKDEAFHGFFQKWKDVLCPTLHAHTEGREVEEILPWLRLATQSDPHNVEIYLVASYWLTRDCHRPDLAIQAIEEAMENNPEHYELPMEKARILLGMDEYEKALHALNAALTLISTPDQPDPEQAAIDLPFILMAQSYVNEAVGNRAEAIASTEQLLAQEPNPHFANRLEQFKAGKLNPEDAKDRLRRMFQKNHVCERDDHEHDHECEHDHGCKHDTNVTEAPGHGLDID